MKDEEGEQNKWEDDGCMTTEAHVQEVMHDEGDSP